GVAASSPCSSRLRAMAASVVAPKVLAFDLSEWAARRNGSARPPASASPSSTSIGGASSRKVSTSSCTKSAPAVACSSAKTAGSIDDVAMSAALALGNGVQRLDQLVDADRLREVVVHSGLQAH